MAGSHTSSTHPAMHWHVHHDDTVQCDLCPFRCIIAPNELGHCSVRRNISGQLVSLNYHRVCDTHIDPIEKKPLFHFYPGSSIFSLACPGCNLQCDFCQNWHISQSPRDDERILGQSLSPETLVETARSSRCQSIAYTYTEPTIFYELAFDTATLAHNAGLKNVFVSNGFINIAPLEKIEPILDAINVDLKAFSDDFYRRRCHARLQPILDTLKWLARSRIWLEVTTLLVPNQNDDTDELKKLAAFLVNDLGPHIPWHISRYHPDYRFDDAPPTPIDRIELAIDIGRRAGLHYVYAGNLPSHPAENTLCPACRQTVIERRGFVTRRIALTAGHCTHCHTPIPGIGL